MPKKFFLFLIIFLFFFGFLLFNFEKPKEVEAAINHNVWGWAWANLVPNELEGVGGWISFNCYNDYGMDGSRENNCISTDYGVNIETSTLKFSGHAWFGGGQDAAGNATATLGWLSFNRSETGAPPFDDHCPDGTCIAKLGPVESSICDTTPPFGFLDTQCGGDNSTTPTSSYMQVFGWARVLAGNPPVGGWDGWIKLSGDAAHRYAVTLDTENNEFRGWAWGGGGTASSSAVVGWISFNCSNENWCSTSTYKVLTSFVINQFPTVSNTSTEVWSCCGLAGKVKYRLKWTYNDDSTPMSQYEIDVRDPANASVYATSVVSVWPPPPTNLEFSITVPDDNLQFGVTYKWYVKVYDSQGADSGWVYGGQFTTLSHPEPYPDFIPQPSKPSVGEIVTFVQDGTDPASTTAFCYSGGEHLCQDDPNVRYEWDFDQNINPGVDCDSNLNPACKGNATTTYSAVGNYKVVLRITDNTLPPPNNWCEKLITITLKLPLPKWKEIKP